MFLDATGVIGSGALAIAALGLVFASRKFLAKRKPDLTEVCPYCEFPLDADDSPKIVLSDRETRVHAACHNMATRPN
jgi:hypothetical protein